MKKFFLIVLFAIIVVCVTSAQCSDMWDDAYSLYKKNDYPNAIKWLNMILKDDNCKDYAKDASILLKKCNEKIKEANKPGQSHEQKQPSTTVSKPSPTYENIERFSLNVKDVNFIITDDKGDSIKPLDHYTYASDISFIQPEIDYVGSGERQLYLYYRIIQPNGELLRTDDSPKGYSGLEKHWIKSGYNKYKFHNLLGKEGGGLYVGGTYIFELYYDGDEILSTIFTLKDRENALSKGGWRKKLEKCCHNANRSYDKGCYKGEIINAENGNIISIERTGLGIYNYEQGKYYIGHWNSNKKEGKGISIVNEKKNVKNCADCKFFVGDYFQNNKSGVGKCYDRLGNLIYYGDFSYDEPTDTYPSNVYDNSYRFEYIEYSNGDCYLGETFYGNRSGAGCYMWSNGDLWYGMWSGDTRDSDGVYMYYDGTIITGKLGYIQ